MFPIFFLSLDQFEDAKSTRFFNLWLCCHTLIGV
uniref:Uncharacterized protein n=1 Tax=Arundo donax TaxID=35708 RepID=A0A0A9B2X4_ARUDO